MKYYLHDSNSFSDDKITMLYIKFDFEALGLFYSILEKLAFQEKPVPEFVLKKQLGIKKRLQKQLDFMYEIGILSLKNGDVFNEKVLKNTEKYQEKKQKNAKKISEWRAKQQDTKNVTSYEPVTKPLRNPCNISKDNISKYNTSKETKNIPPKKQTIVQQILNLDLPYNGDFKKSWAEWVQYRSEIKKPIKTLISAKKQLTELAKKTEEKAVKIIDFTIANGYQGLIYDKFDEKKSFLANKLTNPNKPYEVNKKIQDDPNRLCWDKRK